jgi:hypothetical protein
MNSKQCRFWPGKMQSWRLVWTLCALTGFAGWGRAQTDGLVTEMPAPSVVTANLPTTINTAAPASAGTAGSEILPVGCSTCGGGCSSCGGGSLGLDPLGGVGIPCATGCSCAPCYPGEIPCDCCNEPTGCIHRFLNGLYHCVCCPDPCYVPRWKALANASFFTSEVKPITQIRLGGLFGGEYQFPDKAEYLWAKENAKGPHYSGPPLPPGAKPPGAPNLDYSQGYLFLEGAVNRFGLFVNLPYNNVEPTLYPGASGFGDMSIGTKSLLLDCELIEFTFQFVTYIPTGNFLQGLGVGHVSLEPSLIAALKLTQTTYFQIQTAYWFPIGGDQDYQGPVFHYHLSLNQQLWKCGCEKPIQLIGTAELGGYEIAGGAYTSPVNGLPMSAKDVGSIVQIGPGLRLVICNKIDIGAGSQFAVTKDRMAAGLANVQFRWRF